MAERRGRRRTGGSSHEEGGHGGEEAWLLPYADMITLLLALFLMLYAISKVNNAKVLALQESVGKAFNGMKQTTETPPSAPAGSPVALSPGQKLLAQGNSVASITRRMESSVEKREKELEDLRNVQKRLEDYAKQNGLSKKISTRIDSERGLVIRLLSDDVLFGSGSATLQPKGAPLLRRISQLVMTTDNPIRVDGHTDTQPIATPQFPSNWELSTTRAATVVRFMASSGVGASRLSASGYADQDPVATNSTPTGRSRNRRVEIVLVRRAG